ncbi:MAG: DUF5660 domain-containing protein [Patescibacteria group bacterium]|nr:DUF5660 domain-containing protein [Patescibacteria group bacterium]
MNFYKPQNKKSGFSNQNDTIERLKNQGVNPDWFANEKNIDKETFEAKKNSSFQRKEFTIFNYQEYYERELIKKQIKELTEQIRKEIAYIKKTDASLLSEVKDIEKLSIESLPEKPGIYHIRFLEIVLRILQTLRQKVNESRTWLQAMMSRKKKRGSLFMALSKKKGTQYSLSQELQTVRSVQ